jgi:agmatinase
VAGWDAAGAIAPDERAYLSVDVDAVDPGFAPATGTMEPFGLAPRTVLEVVRAVAPAAAGFDVVEVNDRDEGQTATLAAKLLRAFVYDHAAATTARDGTETGSGAGSEAETEAGEGDAGGDERPDA